MIYEYAIVDNITDEVIGKYSNTVKPFRNKDIAYSLQRPDGTVLKGTAFLSKAPEYWEEVRDRNYNKNQVNKIRIENV